MGETDAMKDKVEGKFHEVKGAATGEAGEEMKGKMQGMKGDVEHKVEEGRRDMEHMKGDMERELERRREDVRDESDEKVGDEVDRRMP